jgi:hypothetical protein
MVAPIKHRMPDYAFSLARRLCEARQRRYHHRFRCGNKKLLTQITGGDPVLERDIEGVFGYMCDIAACDWLGIDPKEEIRSMLVDTDLLTHRDDYDLLHRGWRVDVKMEIFPDDKFGNVIAGTIKDNETYGCRLINNDHMKENSATVDIYLFSTIDSWDPSKAKWWFPLG